MEKNVFVLYLLLGRFYRAVQTEEEREVGRKGDIEDEMRHHECICELEGFERIPGAFFFIFF